MKTYVQVGLGGRHTMFRDAIIKDFNQQNRLLALCDNNPGRLALSVAQASEMGAELRSYHADDFDRMLDECRPDTVIVTTKDSFHHVYICRALEKGCDVITEKPMTIDAEKCRQILETQKKTGRQVRVTFNYRYSPPRTQIKDLLMSGVIGNVLSVDFNWVLDVSHGADYFRRWHRKKENSGGLMVHKATHHFDMVNWWLGTVPETVHAMGHRRFYIPETADRYGLKNRTERCHTCPENSCPFRLELAGNTNLKALYLDTEQSDGYFRDRCVFSPDMDIEDMMAVQVNYANGVKMSYSLMAFSPWEGYQISFSGTKGRLEHKCQESVYINADGSVPGALSKEGTWTRVFPHWSTPYEVPIWDAQGGHGGADPVMLADLFGAGEQGEDPYLRNADQRAGAWSIVTGIAANESMKTGNTISITDLLPGLALPDYPPMPDTHEPLPIKPAEKAE